MRTLKAIADNLADCQPDVFAARLGFLESVNAAWLRQEDVALSHHEKDKVQAPENSTAQDVGSADMLHADEEQQLLDNNQPSGSIEPLISSSETGSSTNQESTTSSFVSEIRLPHVKSRGRPNKRVLQNRFKRPREQDDDRPVPFRQLTEKSQTKLILSGLIDDSLCQRVVDGAYILLEDDLEVRPEALLSALLDCRVSLPKLKKYFSPDAWALLSSSVAIKKEKELWSCGLCKQIDDGQTSMVCCDQCLEWFHWPCAGITKEAARKLWYCTQCTSKSFTAAFD
ncbi:hypothetical protein MRX96_016030 [Rhipicephalus microplus]